VTDPLDHLFRREAGRIAATIARIFGTQNLALAEDVVQEAFCRALEVWPFRGMPRNPSAWLMATAKNCALDRLRHDRTAQRLAPLLDDTWRSEWTLAPALEEQFAPQAVSDDLLRMMFSCCQPRLPESAQVALILHILCGFSVKEVASAFVSAQAAIAKRISRAKRALAESHTLFDLTVEQDFSQRLPAVQRALYLLFNEGYHGAAPDCAVHAELCGEARRLAGVLLEHARGATPATRALAALMSLNLARLPARVDGAGNLVALADQDRSRWDQARLADGLGLLEASAAGSELSPYHIEAAIAAVHAAAPRTADTDWDAIVELYDQLMRIAPSPIVALNRAIAVAEAEGPARGLAEVRASVDGRRLAGYPFYPAALGELELRLGRSAAAERHFLAARALTRSPMERRFFDQRLNACAAAGGLKAARAPSC
jgi:RNA polymerase sigma factor (sigma-70 family)